jgi:hypothetical protein
MGRSCGADPPFRDDLLKIEPAGVAEEAKRNDEMQSGRH